MDLNEALDYSAKRVAALERASSNEQVTKNKIDARTSLALYLFQLFYFSKAVKSVEPVYKSAVKTKYIKRLAQILTVIGAHEVWIKEDVTQGIKQLKASLNYTEDANDMVSRFFAHQWLGFAHSYDCQFDKSLHHFNQALQINTAQRNLWGSSVVMSCISHWVLNYQGNIKKGFLSSERAVKIARESGDVYSRAIAYTHHGISLFCQGHLDYAVPYLEKGIELNTRINFYFCLALAHFFLGLCYYHKNSFSRAQDNHQTAYDLMTSKNCLPSMTWLFKLNAELCGLRLGHPGIPIDRLHTTQTNHLVLYQGWQYRTFSEILLYHPDSDPEKAKHWLNVAVENDQRNKTKLSLFFDYLALYRLYVRIKRPYKAKDELNRAIAIGRAFEMEGWLSIIESIND